MEIDFYVRVQLQICKKKINFISFHIFELHFTWSLDENENKRVNLISSMNLVGDLQLNASQVEHAIYCRRLFLKQIPFDDVSWLRVMKIAFVVWNLTILKWIAILPKQVRIGAKAQLNFYKR